MTLSLTPIDHGVLCHGWKWTAKNIDSLAENVARVAVGQYRHVSAIIDGLNESAPKTSSSAKFSALQNLELAQDGTPYHRDGWLFQVISWIAANHNKKSAWLSAPHIFKAHKGFDGLQIEYDAKDNSIKTVVIFEDKATEDPRATIRDEVWPAVDNIEKGERFNAITHEVSALFGPGSPLDVQSAINNIFWNDARRYRVSISIGEKHASESARKRLFKGFDQLVNGDVDRRRAETMHFDDLRKWMDDFAEMVRTKIKELPDV